MIISIDWLKDFIDIEETPEELSNMLSSLGLEAECDNQFGDIKAVSYTHLTLPTICSV